MFSLALSMETMFPNSTEKWSPSRTQWFHCDEETDIRV